MTKAREIAELGQKLTVDASGNIDVAGIVTADQLTVEGDTKIKTSGNNMLSLVDTSASFRPSIRFMKDDGGGETNLHMLRDDDGALGVYRGGANTKQFQFESNGDISFYNNSGVSKALWDASAGVLGIGTDNPNTGSQLHLDGGTGEGSLRIEGDTNTKISQFASTTGSNFLYFGDTDSYNSGQIRYTHSNDTLTLKATDTINFQTGVSERVRITSSGNVGLGKTDPISRLHVNDTGSDPIVLERNGGTDSNTSIRFKQASTSWYLGATGANSIAFKYNDPDHTAGNELIIKNDGKVGIGITNPKTNLDIAGSVPVLTLTDTDQTSSENQVLGAIAYYTSDASGNGPNNVVRIEARSAGTLGNNGDLVFKTRVGSGEGSDATESVRIDHNGRIGINEASPESLLHIRGEGADDVKIIMENESNPRGNYIGMEGSDNIVIAADEDNVGTESQISFKVDGAEHVSINHNGTLRVNQTGDYSATNAPPAFIQSVGSPTGTSMMLGRNDTGVLTGNNIGAYLFRTNDASGTRHGGMVSRATNSTGDGYVGIYSVDVRLEADLNPDFLINHSMDAYLRGGSVFVGLDYVTDAKTSTAEEGFFAYHNGDGTNVSSMLIRTRDGTGADYVLRHTRRGTIKSEIEEDGSFHSAPNSYGGTSDERLKENITASGSQWDDIKAVQVKKYSWIEDDLDAPNQLGVIAHILFST